MTGHSMNSANQFIGSRISLVSKSEIRYEGVLYSLDLREATISLAKVRSFGTEDRPTERPIPSKEEVYEFIIFRGSDIKTIDVLEAPKHGSVLSCGLPQDPAIIEVSHYRSPMGPFGAGGFEPAGRYSNPRGSEGLFEGLLGLGGRRGGVGARRSSYDNGNQGDRRRNGGGPGRTYVNRNQDMGRRRQDGGYRGGGGDGPRRGGRGGSPNRDRSHGSGDESRGSSGNRPARQRGIIQAQQPPRVTFEEAFDFEKSNEELKSAMEKLKIKDEEADKECDAGMDKEIKKEDLVYYDKDKFFDNISCEALERTKGGKQVRQDWRAERKLNAETFGLVWKPNQNYGRNGPPRNNQMGRMGRGGFRVGNNQMRYNNRSYNRASN